MGRLGNRQIAGFLMQLAWTVWFFVGEEGKNLGVAPVFCPASCRHHPQRGADDDRNFCGAPVSQGNRALAQRSEVETWVLFAVAE